MGMPRGSKPEMGHMNCDSQTYLVKHEGPIVLAYGADTLMLAGWLRRGTGNARAKTIFRTFAARREGAGAWTDISTAKTPSSTGTGGEYCDTQSITGNVMWMQGGLSGGLSAAGSGDTDYSFQQFATSKAQVIASQTFQVEPDVNSTKNAIYPFGPPVPALGFTGAMVCGSITGVSGTLKMNFTWREFTADLKVPGTWNPTGLITETTISADDPDYNTGNMAITPTSGKAFVQIGLWIVGNDNRATLDFTLAVKY